MSAVPFQDIVRNFIVEPCFPVINENAGPVSVFYEVVAHLGIAGKQQNDTRCQVPGNSASSAVVLFDDNVICQGIRIDGVYDNVVLAIQVGAVLTDKHVMAVLDVYRVLPVAPA